MSHRRAAFTLVEMLVVITILLILSTLVFAVFNTGRSSDRMRSAARIAQSALLGAKDRALHAKDLRGVRLTRDTTDQTLVNGFVYLQPITIQSVGNIPGQPNVNDFAVTRPNIPTNFDATQVVISGVQGQAWYQQDQNGVWPPGRVQIRIPSQTGQWLNLARVQNTPPYWGSWNGSALLLTLQVPYQGGVAPPAVNAINTTDLTASCDIQLGNEVLPFHQPIPLSSGVVIDLKFCSTNVQTLAGIGSGSTNYVDIMFSPRGGVTGFLAGLGAMHFLMRDLKDAANTNVNPWAVGAPGSANPDLNSGDRMVLTIFPQTGLVQIFEIDPTDSFTNPSVSSPVVAPGSGGPDGIADNLFNFAQQGKSAGR
jgi:prepilin-type N-terminal cleavage/methylation domain-containing protein